MRQKWLNIALYISVSFALSGCLVVSVSIKKPKDQKTGFSDLLCGKDVKWHIHLQEGFKNDTVLFIVGTDSLLTINDVSTGNNGCTKIYLTTFKEEGKWNLYLENMPSFNLIKREILIPKDSIFVDIIINGQPLKFQESLKRYNYFGFSYDSIGHSITYLRSKECFGCE